MLSLCGTLERRSETTRVLSSVQERLGSRLKRGKQPLFAKVIDFTTANRSIRNGGVACRFLLGESSDRSKRGVWRLINLDLRLTLVPRIGKSCLTPFGAEFSML